MALGKPVHAVGAGLRGAAPLGAASLEGLKSLGY